MVSGDMASELHHRKGGRRDEHEHNLNKLKDISIKVTIKIVNNAHELFRVDMHNVMNKKRQKLIRSSFWPPR